MSQTFTPKQLEKARNQCRAAVRAKPLDVENLHKLGLIEIQLGNRAAAKTWFQKALMVKPDLVALRSDLGLALIEDRAYAEAIAVLRPAVAANPTHLNAVYHLALALGRLGEAQEANALYQRVFALNPNFIDALNSYGNFLFDNGHPAEAVGFYKRVIERNPNFVMAYNNLGLALAHLGQHDAAEDQYRKALALKPDYAMPYNNLGIAQAQRDKFDEAIASYEKALELLPSYAEAHNNLGNALKECRRLDEAEAHYNAALHIQSAPSYWHNLALVQLAKGNMAKGWRNYETRWQTPALASSARNFSAPQWEGEDGNGQTLLIHSEQGFGDTLQFCRYAPLAAKRGWKVILEVQPALKKIIGSLQGIDAVIAAGEPLPAFDKHCPMLSLPFAFGTEVETIPGETPYLFADKAATAAWGTRMPQNQLPRIGIVWAGNARLHSQDLAAANRRRSLNAEQFAPLTALEGATFFSLQKDATPPPELRVTDFMPDVADFADTAALIANLDLVITVDTAVAHLAGALGKPVWLLNRFNGCWRWLQNRDDSPWYPRLRQFRQTQRGDWDSVLKQAAAELANHLREKILF